MMMHFSAASILLPLAIATVVLAEDTLQAPTPAQATRTARSKASGSANLPQSGGSTSKVAPAPSSAAPGSSTNSVSGRPAVKPRDKKQGSPAAGRTGGNPGSKNKQPFENPQCANCHSHRPVERQNYDMIKPGGPVVAAKKAPATPAEPNKTAATQYQSAAAAPLPAPNHPSEPPGESLGAMNARYLNGIGCFGPPPPPLGDYLLENYIATKVPPDSITRKMKEFGIALTPQLETRLREAGYDISLLSTLLR